MYLTDLADVCRAAGLKVIEVSGWRTRGHAPMKGVRSVVCHHTAGAATGNYPSLGVVVNGRAGLAGPLAQLGLGRDGTVYIIAAGVAWHAGATINDSVYGNYYSIGIEAENTGAGQAWPEIQVDAYARLCAALVKHYGLRVDNIRGHKEICSPAGRKIDPAGLPGDMSALRTRAQAYLNGAPQAPVQQLFNDEETTVELKPGENRHVNIPVAGRPPYLYLMCSFGDYVDVHSIVFIGPTPAGDGVDYKPGGFEQSGAPWRWVANRPGPIRIPDGTAYVALRYSTPSDSVVAYVG